MLLLVVCVVQSKRGEGCYWCSPCIMQSKRVINYVLWSILLVSVYIYAVKA